MLVGTVGFEPTTYRLSDDYSTAELRPYGGGGEIRTPDARYVTPALFPLSYAPLARLPGLEPGTSVLGGRRSDHLSYRRMVPRPGVEPGITGF